MFLTLDDLETDASPSVGAGYYASGFLVRDFPVIDATENFQVEGTTIMASAADAGKYEALGASELTHLLLAFDRLATYSAPGRMEPTPKLHGMSGAGVWHFDHRSSSHDKLAGLLIEHHQQDLKVIVATRMGEFLHGLSAFVSGALS